MKRALALFCLILFAGAAYFWLWPTWLWPIARDLPLNIGKPVFVVWIINALLPLFATYYLVGPDYFSQRAQIGFLVVGLTLVLAATIIAIATQNTDWPIMILLILAAAAVLAAFTRRALYGPDPNDDWGDW